MELILLYHNIRIYAIEIFKICQKNKASKGFQRFWVSNFRQQKRLHKYFTSEKTWHMWFLKDKCRILLHSLSNFTSPSPLQIFLSKIIYYISPFSPINSIIPSLTPKIIKKAANPLYIRNCGFYCFFVKIVYETFKRESVSL